MDWLKLTVAFLMILLLIVTGNWIIETIISNDKIIYYYLGVIVGVMGGYLGVMMTIFAIDQLEGSDESNSKV